MPILAILGNEAHTTSRKWANMKINGKAVTFRAATTIKWQTKFGDRHASWCECVFAAKDGDIIEFEAGSDSGNHGANRDRTDIILRLDSSVDVVDVPVAAGKLKGRFHTISDKNNDDAHETAKANL